MSAQQPQSPAAQLRQLIAQHFDASELRALCFDLGLDYDSLPGEGTQAKTVEMIEHFARTGRIAALVQQCAAQRPGLGFDGLLAQAQDQPASFRSIAAEAPIKNVLGVPPEKALRLGFAAGVLAVLLLVCGFGGGLAAGQIITITINPVPVDPNSLDKVLFFLKDRPLTPQTAGGNFASVLQLIRTGKVPPRSEMTFYFDNVQATTLADLVLKADSAAPASEIHVQFLDDVVTVNLRPFAEHERRVLIAYTLATSGGRVILKPQSAWLNVVEIPQTTFGWAPLPLSSSTVDGVTRWIQNRLDSAASSFQFDSVTHEKNRLIVKGRTL